MYPEEIREIINDYLIDKNQIIINKECYLLDIEYGIGSHIMLRLVNYPYKFFDNGILEWFCSWMTIDKVIKISNKIKE